jgi:GntR family transcriptional regulator
MEKQASKPARKTSVAKSITVAAQAEPTQSAATRTAARKSATPRKAAKPVPLAAALASQAPRVPLYEKVIGELRGEILARRYDQAGVLPSESALIERFAVSRITVRRALDELARAGLVERSRGRITRVVARVPPTVIDLTQEMEGTLARSRDLKIRVLGFKWMKPAAEVAETLGVARSDKVLWVTRIRSRADQPIVHTSVYLPAELGKLVTEDELNQAPLVELLRAQGKVVASADQVLSAAPCPPDFAPHLGLKTGEPVFIMRRVSSDSQGRAMFILQSTFRWDCIGYRMSLRPDSLLMEPHVTPHVHRLLDARPD